MKTENEVTLRQALEEILKVVYNSDFPIPTKLNRIDQIAKQAIAENDKQSNAFHWTRINSDCNGNPRFVVHFLQCCPDVWKERNISDKYAATCKLMNKIGGRKYHNKSYGGGIVFSFYGSKEIEQAIINLKNSVK